MSTLSERLRGFAQLALRIYGDKQMCDVGREAADELDRLTARVAELEQVVARCSRVMRGEGVSDQGEAWDLTLRTLDAALESKHE